MTRLLSKVGDFVVVSRQQGKQSDIRCRVRLLACIFVKPSVKSRQHNSRRYIPRPPSKYTYNRREEASMARRIMVCHSGEGSSRSIKIRLMFMSLAVCQSGVHKIKVRGIRQLQAGGGMNKTGELVSSQDHCCSGAL